MGILRDDSQRSDNTEDLPVMHTPPYLWDSEDLEKEIRYRYLYELTSGPVAAGLDPGCSDPVAESDTAQMSAVNPRKIVDPFTGECRSVYFMPADGQILYACQCAIEAHKSLFGTDPLHLRIAFVSYAALTRSVWKTYGISFNGYLPFRGISGNECSAKVEIGDSRLSNKITCIH